MSDAAASNGSQPAAEPRPRGRRKVPRRAIRLAGVAAGVAIAIVSTGLGFMLATGSTGTPSVAATPGPPAAAAEPIGWQRTVVSNTQLTDLLGVRIVGVALTGDGGLVDVRFQVVDADKAVGVHGPTTPPAVVDDATAVVASQLLMGHAHSDAFKAGHTYYLIFENPGNLVQRGGTVSVLLGFFEVEHVTVL